jgi:hypothetical protein
MHAWPPRHPMWGDPGPCCPMRRGRGPCGLVHREWGACPTPQHSTLLMGTAYWPTFLVASTACSIFACPPALAARPPPPGVPGMVAGMLRHLKSLRRMERDNGWINTLLQEAENERMHLVGAGARTAIATAGHRRGCMAVCEAERRIRVRPQGILPLPCSVKGVCSSGSAHLFASTPDTAQRIPPPTPYTHTHTADVPDPEGPGDCLPHHGHPGPGGGQLLGSGRQRGVRPKTSPLSLALPTSLSPAAFFAAVYLACEGASFR